MLLVYIYIYILCHHVMLLSIGNRMCATGSGKVVGRTLDWRSCIDLYIEEANTRGKKGSTLNVKSGDIIGSKIKE